MNSLKLLLCFFILLPQMTHASENMLLGVWKKTSINKFEYMKTIEFRANGDFIKGRGYERKEVDGKQVSGFAFTKGTYGGLDLKKQRVFITITEESKEFITHIRKMKNVPYDLKLNGKKLKMNMATGKNGPLYVRMNAEEFAIYNKAIKRDGSLALADKKL